PTADIARGNFGAERIKGYRPQEIIGTHFSNFYTAEDREAGLTETALGIARAEGRFEREGWRVRKDGTRFWASIVIDV
ncbi:PAS domain S-box protein, partial [Rhizobium johnstonii]|uniref:PAS domain S-box protein n=1 Tax=Rhizobium johnstonii TaxID=3019933 RepID=UPI003F955EAC